MSSPVPATHESSGSCRKPACCVEGAACSRAGHPQLGSAPSPQVALSRSRMSSVSTCSSTGSTRIQPQFLQLQPDLMLVARHEQAEVETRDAVKHSEPK